MKQIVKQIVPLTTTADQLLNMPTEKLYDIWMATYGTTPVRKDHNYLYAHLSHVRNIDSLKHYV